MLQVQNSFLGKVEGGEVHTRWFVNRLRQTYSTLKMGIEYALSYTVSYSTTKPREEYLNIVATVLCYTFSFDPSSQNSTACSNWIYRNGCAYKTIPKSLSHSRCIQYMHNANYDVSPRKNPPPSSTVLVQRVALVNSFSN